MRPDNVVKRRILQGEPVVGIFHELGSVAAAECLGIGGLDFFIIDSEHGPFDVESSLLAVAAAERHGATPFVRVKDCSRSSILKMLDVGAKGLVIPFVESVEEVRKAVEYAKYPPLGRRGYAPTRAGAYGYADFAKNIDTYFETSNDETLLLPQCETLGCLENLEEIISIPGVDGIFVGPYDLSIALDRPGIMDSPEVVKAIDRVQQICEEVGKISMIFAGTPGEAGKRFAQGFDGVACSLDSLVLIKAIQSMVQDIHGFCGE